MDEKTIKKSRGNLLRLVHEPVPARRHVDFHLSTCPGDSGLADRDAGDPKNLPDEEELHRFLGSKAPLKDSLLETGRYPDAISSKTRVNPSPATENVSNTTVAVFPFVITLSASAWNTLSRSGTTETLVIGGRPPTHGAQPAQESFSTIEQFLHSSHSNSSVECRMLNFSSLALISRLIFSISAIPSVHEKMWASRT